MKKSSIIKTRVFGVGLGKTGTSTLGLCLELLGYHVKGDDVALTRQLRQNYWLPIYNTADLYNGFQDFPWPLVYKEMDIRYPNSKFILTTRKDSKAWLHSLCKHADRTGPTEHKQLAYGYEMPHGRGSEHISFYEQHNKEVRSYFGNRQNDFLEVCWEDGDGWNEICDFLGRPLPPKPFPHANPAPNQIDLFLSMMKKKLKRILK